MLTNQQKYGIDIDVDKSTFIIPEENDMVSRFEHFSVSISCIYRYIQKIERVEMEKYGLKGPHAQCLLAMRRFPEGVTSARLCEACDKDKAAVSRMVAELEEKGMVVRNTANGVRYRAVLKLTELGEAAADHVEQLARRAVEEASAGMTEQQRVTMYAALDLIAGNLQTICAEGLK